MQNLNLPSESKEFDLNKKKDLKNSNSLSNCNTTKKINYAIILSILSLLIISVIIFLILFFKLKNTKLNKDKEEIVELICSDGYFLVTDNSNLTSCNKCSISNCKTCKGDIKNNTCLSCKDLYNPKYDNNTIISCDLEELKKNETNNISNELPNEIKKNEGSEIPISKTKKSLDAIKINNKELIKVNHTIKI